MKKMVLIIILLGVFFSCKKEVKVEDKIVVQEAAIVNPSKEEVKQDFTILLKELPKSYIQLTEKDGKQIIFNPCDAANGAITIQAKSNIYELVLMEGHEATLMKIISVEKKIDTYYFDVEVYDKLHQKGVSLKPLGNNFKTALWTINVFGNETNDTYVVADFKDEYPIIDQPCSECWDDCD